MKIIAISDLHGHLPSVPECDLLLVGGDVCPDKFKGFAARHKPELQEAWFNEVWIPWRDSLSVPMCLVTWGNHDFCGERLPEATYFTDGKTTIVACDKVVEYDGLKIYLTPWSNQFFYWAFMKEPKELEPIYAQIPDNIDIIMSHQPPAGYGSYCHYLDPYTGKWKQEDVGSKELLARMKQTKPRAVVCGHIHSGYGTHDCEGIPVYNVSVVNERYELVSNPTEIILDETSTH